VLLDNAAIHKAMQWRKKISDVGHDRAAPLLLPTYSPKLNRIEIVWKHVKYFWRRFVAMTDAALLDEILSLMKLFWDRIHTKFFLTT